MSYSPKNLFSIILIVSVVFILFLSSPVYKVLSGEGNNGGRLIEGMTSSEALSLGLTGDGTGSNPYIIPQKLIIRPSDGQWKDKIKNEVKNETGLNAWGIDDQFMGTGGNMIGDQYRYFAEWWMAKYNPNAKLNIFFAANVRGNNYSNTASDYGLYKFVITGKNNDGSISYSGLFNNKGWNWTSPALSPAPTPLISSTPTTSASKIPDPLLADEKKFASKKCNNLSTRDGNCIPVCVPLNMQKVSGPVYGDPKNAVGPDGLPFNQNTANYFYEKNSSGSGGEYYPITDSVYSRIMYGTMTDCTQDYACSPSGLPGSDGAKAQCRSQSAPPKPKPTGPCDPSCRRVKDPRFAKEACDFNKETGYTCSACPGLPNGEIDCNNFRAKCSGCGDDLVAKFPVGWQPDSKKRPNDKPYTGTDCEINCEKPGIDTFQTYLDTFRDNTGFDSGSCEIIGRRLIKCRPVRKGTGMGTGAGSSKSTSTAMKSIPTPDECSLCDEENLHGYATFERKWDDYTKQNNYVNIKLIDKPNDEYGNYSKGDVGGVDDVDDMGGIRDRRDRNNNKDRVRGASYGPSDGSGGSGGRGGDDWEIWDDQGNNNRAGWRGSCGEDGWYQSIFDAKSKSFQVAAANAESNQQQAYIETLKLQLNKLNDEYTTQKVAINKMKSNIDKQVSACQNAKGKLNNAMMSSVSDDMNKNAAITFKEKIDAIARSNNIAMLEQNVKSACDNAKELSISYKDSIKKLGDIETKRQTIIEKIVIATNKLTENKTTININLGGGAGWMNDCGDRLGCGNGIQYSNIYMNDYFKPQRIDSMVNKINVPMPYQDVILF